MLYFIQRELEFFFLIVTFSIFSKSYSLPKLKLLFSNDYYIICNFQKNAAWNILYYCPLCERLEFMRWKGVTVIRIVSLMFHSLSWFFSSDKNCPMASREVFTVHSFQGRIEKSTKHHTSRSSDIRIDFFPKYEMFYIQ